MAKKQQAPAYDNEKHPLYWPREVWLNSQLSIARHYGGISVSGVRYEIDEATGDLCRPDVAKARRLSATDAQKAAIRARKTSN